MRAPERTPAKFRRGDRVVVEEPNIAPKTGVVGAAKFSPKSGWWVEVRLDEDGMTWSYPETRVRRATSPDVADSTTDLGRAMVEATRRAR